MITYVNRWWGLPLLLRTYGSAFPRAFLFGCITSAGTGLIYWIAPGQVNQSISNPFMYQIFAFVVGFALVFRSSLSFQRYWEARTMLQTMMGRLTCFTLTALAMDGFNDKSSKTTDEQKAAVYKFHHELCHNVSLLFVIMMKHLRKDYNLKEVYAHDITGIPPALDATEFVHGWKRIEVFVAKMFSLHDMFDYFDLALQPRAMPVIGGIRQDEMFIFEAPLPMNGNGKAVSLAGTRAQVQYARILRMYMQHMADGGLAISPSVLGRVSGILEEVMAAYGQANKLATTQFPFPWAQCVLMFLVIMAATLPFAIAAFINEVWIGLLLSFIITSTYWALNEVATEMEDPFGFDPNDLPMARYAFDFNQALLAATYQLRPPFFDEYDKIQQDKAEAEAAAMQSDANLKIVSATLYPNAYGAVSVSRVEPSIMSHTSPGMRTQVSTPQHSGGPAPAAEAKVPHAASGATAAFASRFSMNGHHANSSGYSSVPGSGNSASLSLAAQQATAAETHSGSHAVPAPAAEPARGLVRSVSGAGTAAVSYNPSMIRGASTTGPVMLRASSMGGVAMAGGAGAGAAAVGSGGGVDGADGRRPMRSFSKGAVAPAAIRS